MPPIVPRYDVPERDFSVPLYPVLPVDTTVPHILQQVSEIGSHVASGFQATAVRRQHLEDTTELAKRTMMAETDLDTTLDTIRTNRDTHRNAPDLYTQAINGLSQKWVKDLRPDLATVLTKTLTPKVITGLRSAREIRNAYLIDDAKTTADAVQQDMVDRAGRLDTTDEQAFSRVNTTRTTTDESGQSRTEIVPGEGAYPTYLKSLVDSGLMTSEEALKRQSGTLDAMAYRRLQRMAISDNPGLVQQALDTLHQEEDQKGSTFAQHLTAEHRNTLIQAAQGQRESLISRARTDYHFADQITRQKQADLDAEQKRQDEGELSQLVLGILRGDRGLEDLIRTMIYNRTLRENPTQIEHLQTLIETRGRLGGTTNWSMYNQFRDEIVRSRGAANITDRLLAVTARPGGIARDDADKLMQMSTTVGERSVFKDDFYQAGQKDLDRSLMPPVGVLDEGKQRRYAEASREFFDRASTLVQAGQREKIPSLAREITDRYIRQAPAVTAIAPKDVPRYPDIDSTVTGYIALYGLPERWSPAVTQEFNRQIYIHKLTAPPPGSSAEKPSVPVVKPKVPSKQPNPIAQ